MKQFEQTYTINYLKSMAIFSDIRPACTFVEVKGFINKEWLVETEADCILADE